MHHGSQVDSERLAAVLASSLDSGAHGDETPGQWCVMEAAAWVAGEPWSDHPECVCSVLGELLLNWNDALSNVEERTELLRPLIPEIIGTRGSAALERRRRWRIVDWSIRTYAPAWLDLAGLGNEAAALRALPEITLETIALAHPVAARVEGGRVFLPQRTSIAESVVWEAMWDTAGDAVRSVAVSVSEAAVPDTSAVAVIAIGAVARATKDAEAAKAALRPTVEQLQASVVDLIRELCAMREQ